MQRNPKIEMTRKKVGRRNQGGDKRDACRGNEEPNHRVPLQEIQLREITKKKHLEGGSFVEAGVDKQNKDGAKALHSQATGSIIQLLHFSKSNAHRSHATFTRSPYHDQIRHNGEIKMKICDATWRSSRISPFVHPRIQQAT